MKRTKANPSRPSISGRPTVVKAADTSFNFGYNVRRGGKRRGGKGGGS